MYRQNHADKKITYIIKKNTIFFDSNFKFFFFLSSDFTPSEVCGCYDTMAGYGQWVFQDCTISGAFVCKKPAQAIPLNPEPTGCEKVRHIVWRRKEKGKEAVGKRATARRRGSRSLLRLLAYNNH